MRIILCSGGFDPLHTGHIKYFSRAKSLGDKLFVGVNSDEWLKRKKGLFFLPIEERLAIVSNIRSVDAVFTFNDDDDSAADLIRMITQLYPDDKILFANGGDRKDGNDLNLKERQAATANVEFVFGVGGYDKTNSSSTLLDTYYIKRKSLECQRP